MTPARPVKALSEIEANLPAEPPALHQIAAMPFPASMVAMRKFYNPNWHKPEPEEGEVGKWKVRISYSYREEETETLEVEAASQEEAESLAEAEFDKRHRWLDDVKIDEVESEFLGGAA